MCKERCEHVIYTLRLSENEEKRVESRHVREECFYVQLSTYLRKLYVA